MQPECWPCICLIAKLEKLPIKGCWFYKSSLIYYLI
jgi:hypothetical protein